VVRLVVHVWGQWQGLLLGRLVLVLGRLLAVWLERLRLLGFNSLELTFHAKPLKERQLMPRPQPQQPLHKLGLRLPQVRLFLVSKWWVRSLDALPRKHLIAQQAAHLLNRV
jgi:hypothetical protein